MWLVDNVQIYFEKISLLILIQFERLWGLELTGLKYELTKRCLVHTVYRGLSVEFFSWHFSTQLLKSSQPKRATTTLPAACLLWSAPLANTKSGGTKNCLGFFSHAETAFWPHFKLGWNLKYQMRCTNYIHQSFGRIFNLGRISYLLKSCSNGVWYFCAILSNFDIF